MNIIRGSAASGFIENIPHLLESLLEQPHPLLLTHALIRTRNHSCQLHIRNASLEDLLQCVAEALLALLPQRTAVRIMLSQEAEEQREVTHAVLIVLEG